MNSKKLVSLLLAAVLMVSSAALPSATSASAFESMAQPAAETTDTPDAAATADTPDLPDMTETPAQPVPASPDEPSEIPNDESADEPQTQTEDTPDIEQPPEPETPDIPSPEEPNETADEPAPVRTADVPETSDTPDEPETPDVPTTPDVPEPEPEPEPEPPKDTTPQGDVNGDKTVTSEDALLILRYSVGFYSAIMGGNIKYADMNGDNVIDSSDAMLVLRLTVTITSTPGSGATDSQARNDSSFKRGIDVSFYQHSIDFNKVKASGIDFVIIRAGYGRSIYQKDVCFEQNYARAKAAGLDVGVYWYSYADSAEAARAEARVCMSAIAGKKFEYPIYFDLEEQWQLKLGMNFCSSLVTAFCSELEKYGYYAGYYMSTGPAKQVISYDVQCRYAYWAAEWNSSVHYYNQYGIWQYGIGYVDGINGEVDVDYSYIDYPSVIKEFHLNGY